MAPGAAHVDTPVRDPRRLIAHLGTTYFCFGFSYVIYITFIVTALVREWGLNEAEAGQLWFWIGLISLVSGPLFGALSDRWGRRLGLQIVFALQLLAYLLVALFTSRWALLASIGLFGLVAWSIPTIMAAVVGDYLGADKAASAFGLITFFFAMGQILGPALAGLLAEWQAGFSSSFLLAATITAIGWFLASRLPRPPRRPPSH